ncbi:MAG TPA: hypothetical protein VM716_10625 [Gemmatimonadales bacterium]|nr:hypothetical protein [Gemmatimonadales bacterium]
MTYRQFAAEIGPPLTEAAIKKWPQRRKFPTDVARLIVSKARQRNLAGVTLEWVLWGEGPGPEKGRRSKEPTAAVSKAGAAPAPSIPHGQFARRIAAALEADLSHNEFGQWSTTEVQRTVLWGLKDLARRLRVLHFDMGETFELTDAWAAEIGLPVRPRPSDGDPS